MFKATVNLIQVLWEGPYHFNDLNKLTDSETDYGLYQIYGYHPVYGKSVLLYIGKADQQTFGERISQETWKDVNDSDNDQIYVGRIYGPTKPSSEQWSKEISLVEQLLIYVHKPGFNSSSISSMPDSDLRDIHVLNWGDHRDLYPEVSGFRFTSRLDDDVFEAYQADD